VQSVEIDPLMYLIDRDRSNNRVNNAGMNLTRTSRP